MSMHVGSLGIEGCGFNVSLKASKRALSSLRLVSIATNCNEIGIGNSIRLVIALTSTCTFEFVVTFDRSQYKGGQYNLPIVILIVYFDAIYSLALWQNLWPCNFLALFHVYFKGSEGREGRGGWGVVSGSSDLLCCITLLIWLGLEIATCIKR